MSFLEINPFVRIAYECKWNSAMSKNTYAYDCRFYYLHQGSGELVVNNKKYNAKNGKLFYIPMGCNYKFNLSDDSYLYVICFDMYGNFTYLKEPIVETEHNSPERSVIPDYELPARFSKVIWNRTWRLFENVKRCVDEFSTMGPYYREFCSGIIKSSLVELLRDYELDTDDEYTIASKALLYARHNSRNPMLSNEDIAAHVGYHPYYVSNLVKKATGLSLRQYIINTRLKRARNLLCSTKIEITTIATDCGFNSVTYFNRIFKENVGVTPGEYRKTHMLL